MNKQAWIITHDAKTKESTVWLKFSACDRDMFKSFMQYIINSCTNAKDFMLYNPENGLTYDAYRIATEQYGIHKQTFDERMNAK